MYEVGFNHLPSWFVWEIIESKLFKFYKGQRIRLNYINVRLYMYIYNKE